MATLTQSAAFAGPVRTIGDMELAPSRSEAATLLMASALCLILYVAEAYWTVWIVGSVLLAVTMGFANWHLARTSVAAVWTPLFAFRLGTFVYLGIGPLLPIVLGAEALDRLYQLYPYSDAELAKVTMIWLLATTIVIVSCRFYSTLELRIRHKSVELTSKPEPRTLRLGLVFFGAGLVWSLMVELPQHVGWFAATIPGSLALPFQAAGSVGIFLIALWAMERGGFSHFAYLVPLGIMIVIGLITFNKSIIIAPLLFVSLAILFRGVTVIKVALVTGILVMTFAVLQPMVAQARFLHMQAYGNFYGGTLAERLGYSIDYIAGERISDEREQHTFTRLVYNAPAAFVVTRYDLGLPDDSIASGFIAMIPRILWPNKPITTAIGAQVNELITGGATSQLGVTVAADIYWNWGWVGLFVLLVPFGALLWPATRLAHEIVATRDWIMMPFVLLLFKIGLAVDSIFVAAVLVPSLAAVIAYGLLHMVKRILNPQVRTA
jgi:hypothetical protein